jgi:hypothetical protein
MMRRSLILNLLRFESLIHKMFQGRERSPIFQGILGRCLSALSVQGHHSAEMHAGLMSALQDLIELIRDEMAMPMEDFSANSLGHYCEGVGRYQPDTEVAANADIDRANNGLSFSIPPTLTTGPRLQDETPNTRQMSGGFRGQAEHDVEMMILRNWSGIGTQNRHLPRIRQVTVARIGREWSRTIENAGSGRAEAVGESSNEGYSESESGTNAASPIEAEPVDTTVEALLSNADESNVSR